METIESIKKKFEGKFIGKTQIVLCDEVLRILSKYPERVPVLVENEKKCELVLDKRKYLVPIDLTMGQFMFVIRKRLRMAPEQAMFMFVNGHQFQQSVTVKDVYDEQMSSDGFLRVSICQENVFG
jgi:GABA(A) receptor-associated protein